MAKIILSTERLILRTWKPSDIPLMTAISSDPMVMEHFPGIQDSAATQALIDHINQHYKKFGYALYAVEIKVTHEFIASRLGRDPTLLLNIYLRSHVF